MNKKTAKTTIWLLALMLMLQHAALYAEDAADDTASDAQPAAEALSEDAVPAEEAAAEAPAETVDEPVAAPEATLSPLSSEGSQEEVSQAITASPLGIDEKVSLDLRNIEVAEALRFLAQKGGMNMAISKSVSGRVQLLLNEVPIRDILDIILLANDLAYDKHGDVYNIMSGAEYKERYGRKFSDIRKIKVFRLKYAVPDQAFSLFEVLKSDVGRLLVDPDSGTVLVMDTEENIKKMEEALAGLEERKNVKVYSLKYAKALDVETRLKAQLDNKKVGFISADERTNQVIVETLTERMKDIDALIYALDQKTREVLIDTKIIKVTITDNTDAEIKWEGLFQQFAQAGIGFISNHPFSPVLRAGEGFIDDFTQIPRTANVAAGNKNELTENLFIGHAEGQNPFEVLINYLKTLGDTKILSNPKLAVVNNQEAKIHVGEKQAYVTTTTTSGTSGTTTTAEQVTFVDVGIQLAVTPTINEDGFVTMKIKPEISSVSSFLTTPSGNKIPIIDSSLAETSVMVKDGVTLVIGGLRKDERVVNHKKIPFVGDLPVIGYPFNSKTDHMVHTELLILITPHIMYGDKLVEGSQRSGNFKPIDYTDYEAPKTGDLPNLTVTDYGGYPATEVNRKEQFKMAPVRS